MSVREPWFAAPIVTVTCECGQTVEHEQTCSAVPRLMADSLDSPFEMPLLQEFDPGADVFGWLRRKFKKVVGL